MINAQIIMTELASIAREELCLKEMVRVVFQSLRIVLNLLSMNNQADYLSLKMNQSIIVETVMKDSSGIK